MTTQQYLDFFVQDQWKVERPADHQPRRPLRAGDAWSAPSTSLTTLDGETLDNFPLKNNWAPRIGVVYDVLGNGKSKLFGNYGRFYARIPNDLAARALSADDGTSRADYFDAALTRPIPNGVARPAGDDATTSSPRAWRADLIDPDAKLSYQGRVRGRLRVRGAARTPTSASATSTATSAGSSRTSPTRRGGLRPRRCRALSSVEYILTNPESTLRPR